MAISSIFSDGEHLDLFLGEPEQSSANRLHRYLIVNQGSGLIVEHGFQLCLEQAFEDISYLLSPADLAYVFIGTPIHRMEDAINRWLLATGAKAICGRAWINYMPDFQLARALSNRLWEIPDEGMHFILGKQSLHLIPMHFLYKPCAFCLYDPLSKTLFSGNLASSVGTNELFAESFETLKPYLLKFHQRYAHSNAIISAWVQRVKTLDIQTVAPGRGSIIRGYENVRQLWQWLEEVPCGVDLLPASYPIDLAKIKL